MVNRESLSLVLERGCQKSWITRCRISALLALLKSFAARIKKSSGSKAHGIHYSNRLARGYCSPLRAVPPGVLREPLAVLVRVGILEIVAPAMVDQFSKTSARYRFAPAYQSAKLQATDEETNACVRRKLEQARARLERGLNRRWPFRAQLLQDLSEITMAPSQAARDAVDALLRTQDTRTSTKAVVSAITTREHKANIKPSGLIVTSLISCPRELKPHLCLAGEPVELCDISSAHWMFLPRLITNRLDYLRQRGDDENELAPLKAELHRLIELCSSGSFYQSTLAEGATPEDVKRRKKLLNVLLNSPRSKSANNCVWRSLRARFPNCITIIDAIKRDDHRRISKQFQHFTANAITAALIELQAQGTPCIPDTDCLMVRQRDKLPACRAIGAAMFRETRGVLITVGGIKYQESEGNG